MNSQKFTFSQKISTGKLSHYKPYTFHPRAPANVLLSPIHPLPKDHTPALKAESPGHGLHQLLRLLLL